MPRPLIFAEGPFFVLVPQDNEQEYFLNFEYQGRNTLKDTEAAVIGKVDRATGDTCCNRSLGYANEVALEW